MVRSRSLRELRRGLSEAGIDSIFLKGVALAEQAYPHPCARGMGDIDVWVRPEQLPGVVGALEAVGFRVPERYRSAYPNHGPVPTFMLEASFGPAPVLAEIHEHFVAEVSRERDMTVSGMEGEETTRIWNGSGSSEMSRSGVLADGTERSHSASGTFTFQDIVVPIPGSESPYPVSGMITRSMVGTRTNAQGTETRAIEMIITFNGTSIATAVVNGETVEIDLSARPGMIPLRRQFPRR